MRQFSCFQRKIEEYVLSKLQPFHVPFHISIEIAQYAANEMAIVVNDELWNNDLKQRRETMVSEDDGR